MRPNWHNIISEAVERGATFGVRRAHKHVDRPTEEEIIDHVSREVMTAIYEWVEFDDVPDCQQRQE